MSSYNFTYYQRNGKTYTDKLGEPTCDGHNGCSCGGKYTQLMKEYTNKIMKNENIIKCNRCPNYYTYMTY